MINSNLSSLSNSTLNRGFSFVSFALQVIFTISPERNESSEVGERTVINEYASCSMMISSTNSSFCILQNPANQLQSTIYEQLLKWKNTKMYNIWQNVYYERF